MANDPGLAGDTCIFVEAIVGDGGNQNPNDVWWLSPDITLAGPVSGLETADVGHNTIKIRFHRKSAGNCTFPGDESITVQAWVANPSLIMSPQVHGSAARVGFIGSQVPGEGQNHVQQIDWTVLAVSISPPLIDNPLKPGPKCLVAICYPDSLSPSTTRFFVPGDQHVAQHNLCVIVTAEKSLKFEINTFNPNASTPLIQPVKLRAVLDLAPSLFVKKMVLSRVQTLPAFQQLRTSGLPQGFAFDLTVLQSSNIVDHSHATGPFAPPHLPSYQAAVQLPGALTKIKFVAGLRDVQPGEVCIFHLTQTFKDLPQGGLTVAVLKT